MDLCLDPTIAEAYTSKAQRSRVITEAWAAENLYCAACGAEHVEAHRPGKRVEDFFCPTCDRRTQLKAARNGHGRKVTNSAYQPKIEAIRANNAPDYALMAFDADSWRVQELTLVPGHFITEPVIERRKPLRSGARRAGWVGSNILLDRIPEAGRISVIRAGSALPRARVVATFERTAFLERRRPETRGWLSAVLDCLDELGIGSGDEFELNDVYRFEGRLAMLYPDNHHIKAKIRQQLQVLRDEGLVEFLGRGEYRMRA